MSNNLPISLLGEMAIFVRVVERGSFTGAARELGMSTSSVSRSISRLERALGTKLLQRTTRRLRLSESGQAIHERCLDMMSAARSIVSISEEYGREVSGSIRVSAPKAIGRVLIHPHILRFLDTYTKADVRLVLDDRHVDLIDGDVDMVLRVTDRPPPGLAGRRLSKIEHAICATPQYLAKHGTPTHPRDLVEHSCLCLGEMPGDARWRFKCGDEAVTVNVRGRYWANHTEVRLEGVQAHLGIGSLPFFTARRALHRGEIVRVLPEWEFITGYCGDLWLLYTPTRYMPLKFRVFIDHLAAGLEHEPALDMTEPAGTNAQANPGSV
ncbi:transcriptional regulator [Acidihalobacter yilgarnensis]|uniref:Transcriptional regulator n=1 Tax=Acidihalobacter yilgarnensis TaxID=2819280 RepID=A0A1D8IRX2_9GAMM|nr:LysR family transcriptional regulator [Acidihalobacter yilgarnensis]AOU99153.1 transcriptional regulator [Acidihalobacter yilgarnensis]